jgi:hypothetical protein
MKGGARIEVKHDKRAIELGTLYVEYECRGQPSGISTTQADLWVFVIDLSHCAIVLSTERLKDIARHAYKDTRNHRECRAGSHPTKGVAIPLADLMPLVIGRPLVMRGGQPKPNKDRQ